MDVFKGDPVAVNIGGVVFYGNVTGSHMHEGTKITGKVWNIKYDLVDEEEVNTMQLMTSQKLYSKEHQYNTKAHTKPPAQSILSTTKKKNTAKK